MATPLCLAATACGGGVASACLTLSYPSIWPIIYSNPNLVAAWGVARLQITTHTRRAPAACDLACDRSRPNSPTLFNSGEHNGDRARYDPLSVHACSFMIARRPHVAGPKTPAVPLLARAAPPLAVWDLGEAHQVESE